MSFLEDRDPARLGRDAREWLTHDERGRVIGLVVVSIVVSIAISLLVTALVGLAGRRRAAAPADPVDPEGAAAGDEPVGIPVMEPAPAAVEAPVEA